MMKMRLFYVLSIFLLAKVCIGNIQTSGSNAKDYLFSVFEGLGYTPVCIASALATCERYAKPDCFFHVRYMLPELKQILQEVNCDRGITAGGDSLSNLVSVIPSLIKDLTSIKLEDKLQNITDSLRDLRELEHKTNERSSTFENLIRNEIRRESEILKNEGKKNAQELHSRINAMENRYFQANNLIHEDIKLLRDEMKLIKSSKHCPSQDDIQSILEKGLKKEGKNLFLEGQKLIPDFPLNEIKTLIEGFIIENNNNASESWDDVIEQFRNDITNLNSNTYLSNPVSPTLEPKKKHKNCAELKGVQTIYPYGSLLEDKPVEVFCDETDGGGWTVIQNRDSSAIRQDFYRPWRDYVTGFGDVKGEFWLGLENIYALVKSTPVELRVDLEDFDGVKRWAKYENFKVGDASTKYVLTLGSYFGDAGDALRSHNGMKFSTYDQDNDEQFVINCSKKFRGAWWYNACETSNLNGYQHKEYYFAPFAEGIEWNTFRGEKYSLKKTRMKIRVI